MPVEDLLWSELHLCPDYSKADLEALLFQLDNCNKAVQSFITGQLDEETFLDILEANGHNIDDFLSVTESNLIIVGL